ncbi:DEAD-box ATP-dependent RNA helicase [Phlyctochytrium bullatum]|nr:DEAD-box ATP-dependent RNA helicase [Phlyctochytrium bullatum]
MEIVRQPQRGRGFVASKSFRAGQVVLISHPYAVIPDSLSRKLVCAGCVKQPNRASFRAKALPFACQGRCDWAWYCSEGCRTSDWESGHRHECPALSEFDTDFCWDGKTAYVEDYVWLLLRILIKYFRTFDQEAVAAMENDDGGSNVPGNTFADLWKACTNASSFEPRLDNELSWVCIFLTHFVVFRLMTSSEFRVKDYSNILPAENDAHIQSFIDALLPLESSLADTSQSISDNSARSHRYLQNLLEIELGSLRNLMCSVMALICKEECNSFGLYTFDRLGHTEERQGYALGYYPSPIFFNHSCTPNIGHVNRDSWRNLDSDTNVEGPASLIFYALSDISTGDELCISYLGPTNHDYGFDRRRATLSSLFFFDCDCRRCALERSEPLRRADAVNGQLAALVCGRQECKGFYRPHYLSSRPAEGAGQKRIANLGISDSQQGGGPNGNAPRSRYVPPHLRNQPQAAQAPAPQQASGPAASFNRNDLPPRAPSAGADRSSWNDGGDKGWGGGGGGYNRNSYSGGSGGRNGDSYGGARDYGGGFGGRSDYNRRDFGGGGGRTHQYNKDPSDEFYHRPDVKPRDPKLESQLYGSQHNSGINFDKYDDIPVETSGNEIPEPISSFEESQLDELLKSNVKLANYTSPTPVQRHSVSIVTGGRDLMACAQTGSGKTAAFLVPILSQNFKDGPPKNTPPPGRGRKVAPITLILAPTRELALQIYEESRKFAYRSWVRPCVVYGGTPMAEQRRDLERGCELLVATPGRLVDLIERGSVSLASVRYLVLDEADRMLDMGFEPQIRRIVEQEDMGPPETRQTLMFSATFPRNIQMLARDFLKDYVFLTVGRVGSTSENITQRIEYVEEEDKRSFLLDILHSDPTIEKAGHPNPNLTLVFVETKRGADMLCDFLINNRFPATAIHGDRTQREREWALQSFKSGKTPVLVATAVAARGLDIPNVTHVINFDLPSDIDDYVHRIGRTGRAGNVGKATAFFNHQSNRNIVRELIELLSEAKQDIPPWLESAGRDFGYSSGRGGRGGRGGGRGRGSSRSFGAVDHRKETGYFNNSPSSGGGFGGGAYGGGNMGGAYGNYSSGGRSTYQSNNSANNWF